MKIKTNEAAIRLGVHPAHLLLHLGNLDRSLSFEDVWPEIESGLIETIEVSSDHKAKTSLRLNASQAISHTTRATPLLSSSPMKILDKLQRHNKWANVCVSHEALMNITHLSSSELLEALIELRKLSLLDPDHDGSSRGTVSLDPGRRNEIEKITGHTC